MTREPLLQRLIRALRRWKPTGPRGTRQTVVLWVCLFFLSLGVFYLVRLGALRARVLDEFESLSRNAYFQVYSAPLAVRVGTDARAAGIEDRLERAGLVRVLDRPRPGQYRTQHDHIELHAVPGVRGDSGRIELALDGGVIEGIAVDGEQREQVELPAEYLTSFRRSLWEKRTPARFEDIPPGLLRAVLAAEDRRFFAHRGVDARGIGRALLRNLRRLRVVEGGSTITQQVVKQILRRRGRALHAKIDEGFLALVLESRFSKQQILQVYANEVYFGQEGPFALHGVAEGARYFFGKKLRDLSQRQQIELAAAIRAPNAASPKRNRDKLEAYADAVAEGLSRVETPETSDAPGAAELAPTETGSGRSGKRPASRGKSPTSRSKDTPPGGKSNAWKSHSENAEAPEDEADTGTRPGVSFAARGGSVDFAASQMAYYFDLLSREWKELSRKQRLEPPAVLVAGVDPVLQMHAASALRKGLARDRVRPKGAPPDTLRLQGAVVALDVETGVLRAVVGGDDYRRAPFNRAVDIARPVGSTFKPIVYLAALGGRDGNPRITQSSWLPDEPREYRIGLQTWRPANFDGNYKGWVTAREALGQSLNAATVALGMEVGVEDVARLAEDLGVQEHIPAHPSLLLGAVETSPLRLAGAYAALANGGWKITPHALVEVQQGQRVWQAPREAPRRLLDPQATYIVTDMLVAALRTGTGRTAEHHGFQHLATGKTGTTDDNRDAWFAGYTREMVATVWVGYDNNSEADLTGAGAALPIWALLMRNWLGHGWDRDFELPQGIAFFRIDPSTGELAARSCPQEEFAAFVEGTEPTSVCSEHRGWWERPDDNKLDEDELRELWPHRRPKRGFWSRLKDVLGV